MHNFQLHKSQSIILTTFADTTTLIMKTTNNNFSLIKNLIIVIIISFSVNSCQEPEDYIPYVYVNHTVYLSNPTNYSLQVPGNYLEIPEIGVNGIVLYRKSLGDEEDFVAFDRTCTYQPLENCIVEADSTGFYLDCPCCGSKFFIMDGFVHNPPATLQLKQYRTSFNGSDVRIFN